MSELINELKRKHVRIAFLSGAYQNGGVAAANYVVIDGMDGFLKLKDDRDRTVFYRLDLIKQITVLPECDTDIQLEKGGNL